MYPRVRLTSRVSEAQIVSSNRLDATPTTPVTSRLPWWVKQVETAIVHHHVRED
jgi:hypothetical protein